VEDEFVRQLVNHVIAMGVQLVDIEFLDALMVLEFGSGVLFVANLAHHFHFRAISLDVVVELRSRHVLKLFTVADIAAKFWTFKLSMGLKLAKSFPDNLRVSCLNVASMRELTEVNTVSKDFIHLL
jgi:hypothetical protein